MRLLGLLMIALLLPRLAAAQPAAGSTTAGSALYQQHCSVCHGSNGEGGVGPSFVGNKDIASTPAMLHIVLFGKGAMPAWGQQLTDQEIADITTFERTSWGNTFGDITVAEVTQARTVGSAGAPAAAAAAAPATATTGPATVDMADSTTLGAYLLTAAGLPLYRFENDSAGNSSCYSPCNNRWLPLLTVGTPVAGSGVNAALLGTATRTDGTIQVTYNGWPLYTNVADTPAAAGAEAKAAGVGISGLWQLVTPDVLPAGTSSGQ
jgi:mono/diheme cytochrome c family protein